MTRQEIEEASRRLQQDIRVVESAKGLSKNKHWVQLSESLIVPSIRRCYQELENAAKHMKGFAYYQKFYSTQGMLKTLEMLEDMDALADKYDQEIKGLKKLLNDAKES